MGQSMKTLAAVLMFAVLMAGNAQAKVVHSYTKKDGTFVQSYQRSSPDNKRYNNYNSKTRGVNPYTGKRRYQRDELSNPPAYNKRRSK